MATYYVTQAGAGAANGTTYADSMSVATHNTTHFSANDVVYICDTITQMVKPHSQAGTAGNPIIYRGDYAGHSGIINCGDTDDATHNYCFRIQVDYVTVKNLTVTRASWEGISVYRGIDIVLDGIVAHDIDIDAVAAGIRCYGTVGAIIRNCTIYDIAWNGIQYVTQSALADIDGLEISNNTLYNCLHDCIDMKIYSGASLSNAVIKNNVMYDSAAGIYSEYQDDEAIIDPLIYNNYIYNIQKMGIGSQTIGGDVDTAATAWKIYNNTLVNTGILGTYYAIEFLDGVVGGVIENNILSVCPQGKIRYKGAATTNLTENNNCLFGANAVAAIYNGTVGVALGSNDIATDPFLSGHILLPSSPCIRAGLTIEAVTHDIDGYKRPGRPGNSYSIGCCEYLGTNDPDHDENCRLPYR